MCWVGIGKCSLTALSLYLSQSVCRKQRSKKEEFWGSWCGWGLMSYMVCGILGNPLNFVHTVLCLNVSGISEFNGNDSAWSHCIPWSFTSALLIYVFNSDELLLNKWLYGFGGWKMKCLLSIFRTLHFIEFNGKNDRLVWKIKLIMWQSIKFFSSMHCRCP